VTQTSTVLTLASVECLHKLDQHQGFVKGVCWDPVGQYLATQSDDRSVKIWRTLDWDLEAEVRKPFEDSPGSTFFRRLRQVSLRLPLFVLTRVSVVGPPMAHILPLQMLQITKDSFSSLL
jgi:WD40 repeat protein